MYTKGQLLPEKRVSRFYESNVSMISESKSNLQNNRKYISLCNSFTLSRIKFTFAIDPPWDGRHQPGTSLLW